MADGFGLGQLPSLHLLQEGQVHQHRRDDHQDPRKNHTLGISHETTKFGCTAWDVNHTLSPGSPLQPGAPIRPILPWKKRIER